MAKLAAKKEMDSSQDSFSMTCSSIVSGVISFFMLVLVTVFPLIYDKSYVNILETKYKCFYMSILAMIVVLLVLSIVMLVVDLNEFGGQHAKMLFSALAPKNWKTTFHVADAAVLIFWCVCLISTLQSEYLFEAFWGNEGRFTGLFLITLYVAAYFIISRFWKLKGWVVQAFLIAGLVVCYIGITDYFQLDILHFRGKIKPSQSTMFTSTIGNINTFTAYVALVMGAATALFTTSKGLLKSIWYYLCMVVAFFAIIMGCSDNAYLAIGALFAFLPFVLFKSKDGVVRYLVVLATFATVIQCIDYINQKFAEMVIGLDSLFKVLVNFGGLEFVVIALWAVTAGVWFACRLISVGGKKLEDLGNVKTSAGLDDERKGGNSGDLGNLLVYIWLGIVIAGALAVCFALYDANALGNSSRYGGLGKYLVFNDQWGTNRGYIWRKSIELYRDFPVIHKLFGYGPDTFGILTTRYIMPEMNAVTGQTFDSAHNEYLQFLVTIGPFGLVAYVVFLAGSVWQMAKGWLKNPYVIGCMMAVLCYAFQALVNLNLPIATPLMWLLLAAGVGAARSIAQKAM